LDGAVSEGLVVSELSFNVVAWELVASGARRSVVLEDLGRLGLEVVDFSERFSARVRELRLFIPNLSLDAALAVALAEVRKLEMVSGEHLLEGRAFGVRVRVVPWPEGAR
jgi:hypothetical protein